MDVVVQEGIRMPETVTGLRNAVRFIDADEVYFGLVKHKAPRDVRDKQLRCDEKYFDFVLFDQVKDSGSVCERYPRVVTECRDFSWDFLDLIDH